MEDQEILKLVKKINKEPFSADELTQIELESVIKYAADKFFNTKKPIMEDNVYDIIIDFLKEKFPKSKTLKTIGSIPKTKNKVKLDYWLGSMDKIKPNNNDFEKWFNKYSGPYVISDKLDGVSALLIYRSNSTINMYTRGTAEEGTDITELLKYINVPSIDKIKAYENKSEKSNILMAFRGELIIDKETFNKNWSDKMKNARNTVSGLVNSKTINPKLAMDTKFVAYEIVDPILLPNKQLKLCKEFGFNTVKYKLKNELDIETISEYFKKRREESEYMIDGIIVTNNEIYERNKKSNPEYSFAFKDVLEDQLVETKVLDIEWNISKDGLIKPVLMLEPVEIGGVEISRVTAHNAKNVVALQLGKGAIIKLVRSGDVIPKIIEVIKPAKKVLLPPEDTWVWNETKVDIVSTNTDSKEKLIKNIYYFFSTLKTIGMGEKIVEKLVDSGFDTIKKILESKSFEEVDGIQKKSSDNLLESIKKSTLNVELSTLIVASNMAKGIGEERIGLILDKYPNLLTEYKNFSKEEFIDKIKEINGFEEKLSKSFVNNFEKFIKFYKDINKYVTIQEQKVKKITKNKYSGLTIVISGFRNQELQKFLEDSGAKITNSVSKNTDLLIVKDQNTILQETGKVRQAINLDIKIITSDDVKF
jgi:NAD-dependent DNA ligase